VLLPWSSLPSAKKVSDVYLVVGRLRGYFGVAAFQRSVVNKPPPLALGEGPCVV
jgi:hypothetical protein